MSWPDWMADPPKVKRERPDLILHSSGLGYQRACTQAQDQMLAALANPHPWHPSAADDHDRGESCGEVECGRCNP